HTHKPGITNYTYEEKILTRYVLSDWDDIPKLLCYDNTKGFYFTQYDIN
ncbi:UDP-2,3-diacylglucosamine diphosphatase, partial [Legionella pneumophila serogroup 1]